MTGEFQFMFLKSLKKLDTSLETFVTYYHKKLSKKKEYTLNIKLLYLKKNKKTFFHNTLDKKN